VTTARPSTSRGRSSAVEATTSPYSSKVADLHRDHRRDREAGLPNELDVRRGHLLHGAEPLPLSRLELHLAFLSKAHA
jgi:hypothetical protein